MLVRVTIEETGTVAFFRIPETRALVKGANVVFEIRDDKGNGPDFIGTLVGKNDEQGQLVELSLRHDDVAGFQHEFLVRSKGELIPGWKSDEFEQVVNVWNDTPKESAASPQSIRSL